MTRLSPSTLVVHVRANAARLIALVALVGVLLGIALAAADMHRPADLLWAATTAMLLVPLTISVLRSLLRGDVGVDAIALVSMAGALALGEYLAGAVVALMLAGGNALEESASRRARRELSALVERAPRSAIVRRGEELVEVPIDEVAADDIVLVRAGEVVPVDGMVESQEAIVDESALTGEPLPVTVHRGGNVRSGTAAAGAAFELPRSPARLRERLCGARAPRPGGGGRARPVRTDRRPLRPLLPARDDGDRDDRVGGLRGPGPGARGLRRRNPLPADPGGADRADVRPLAGRARRCRRQGRRHDRATRRGALGAPRQDGHDHARPPRARPRRLDERAGDGGDAAAGRVAGPALGPPAREGARRGRRGARRRADDSAETRRRCSDEASAAPSTATRSWSAAGAGCASTRSRRTSPRGSTAATRRCSSASTEPWRASC